MNLQLLTQWALTSALLILAVLAVRFFTRGRLSCINRYALWAVVLARLLVPFQLSFLPSPDANATDLVPTMPSVLERPLTPDTAMGYASISPDRFEGSGFHIQEDGTVLSDEPSWYPVLDQETGSIKAYFGGFTVEDTILAVWGWGAVLAGGVILLSNLCFWLRLTRSRREISVQNVNLRIYTTKCISSPCLFGLFRPAIYLPPETLEDEQTLRHVLAHELTHYAHRDHIWSLLRCLALALHWYNPLVWLAVVLSKRDGELACDEGAVARLGEEERIPYGRTLVDMVARRSLRPGDLLSCSTSMTEGKKTIQQRVALLVKRPETKKTALFAALAAVALAVVFTFAGGGKPSDYSYEGFTAQVEQVKAIQFSLPPTYSYGYPPIEDSELLEQAKELLLRAEPITNDENATSFGFGDMALSSHYLYLLDGDRWTAYCLFPMEGGPVYVLTLLDDDTAGSRPLATLPDNTLERLEEVALEQQERNQSVTRVEYPEFKAALTALFLGDEECVARNESEDYDMEEWLTNYTTFYEISYAVPWWLEGAEKGWYARAVDAGSWYSISIPDHLAEQVQAICREQARYPSANTIYSALESADTIQYAAMSAQVRIDDPEVIDQITQLLLCPGGDDALSQFRGRVTVGEEFGMLTIPVTQDRNLSLCLQEVDGGCLLACAWTDGIWSLDSDTLPVLWVLPAGAAYEVYSIYETWYAEQQQSPSTPALEEPDGGEPVPAEPDSGSAPEEPDGGSPAPVTPWGAGQEFSLDMEAAMNWNTDLRAVVRKDGDKAGMTVSGETGALCSLTVGLNGVSFEPYYAGGLVDNYTWGEALNSLASAGACLNRDEQPDGSPAGRAEVAKWLRVTKNGQEVPGLLSWGHGNGSAWFNFDFDTPLTLEEGDIVTVEIGPARKHPIISSKTAAHVGGCFLRKTPAFYTFPP